MAMTSAAPTTAAPTVSVERVIARRLSGVAGLVAILAGAALVSLAVGSRSIALGTTWDALWSFDPTNDEHLVIRNLRVPRTVLGMVVGSSLGTAGAVMQALTRNPLAEPGVLAVNSGAAAAVAVAIGAGITSVSGYVWFACLGAAGGGALVFVLGGAHRRGADPVRLLLAGAALSIVLGSFTQLLLLNYPETYVRFRFWAVGSLQGRSWEVIGLVAPLTALGVVCALAMSRSLNAIALGADSGRALGVSMRRVWSGAALTVILLTGAATAGAGPIAFVGLTAPHAARAITGPDNRWVLPYSKLISAVVILVADIAGRLVARPGEVATGIVTALIGGPLFVVLVRRRRLVAL